MLGAHAHHSIQRTEPKTLDWLENGIIQKKEKKTTTEQQRTKKNRIEVLSEGAPKTVLKREEKKSRNKFYKYIQQCASESEIMAVHKRKKKTRVAAAAATKNTDYGGEVRK